MSANPNWYAARRAKKRRQLARESRADAGRSKGHATSDRALNAETQRAVGSTTNLPFPAHANNLTQLEQDRYRHIAERHADSNNFCAGIMRQIRDGHRITPQQAAVLLDIEQRRQQPPSRRDTTHRTDAQSVTCPQCHARPGQPCHGRDGPRRSCHLQRHRTYLAAHSSG